MAILLVIENNEDCEEAKKFLQSIKAGCPVLLADFDVGPPPPMLITDTGAYSGLGSVCRVAMKELAG